MKHYQAHVLTLLKLMSKTLYIMEKQCLSKGSDILYRASHILA